MLAFNAHPDYGQALLAQDAPYLSLSAASEAQAALKARGDGGVTPLIDLPHLAQSFGLAALQVKDESHRLGLGSFKALGGAFAVIQLVIERGQETLGMRLGVEALASGEVRNVAKLMTFTCATDGNHGRSVAQGASLVGARAVVFVHQGVSPIRINAIKALGAEVRIVEGVYDDAVDAARAAAVLEDWSLVSDTSWPGYERVPCLVMQGYLALVAEVLDAQIEPATHLFIQAGVGGLAAAMAGHFAIVLGSQRPRIVVVEPDRAACLLASIQVGRRLKIAPAEPTGMAMLECYEPSLIAWRVLTRAADAFITVSDNEAEAAVKCLSCPGDGDQAIESSLSGAAGMAGLFKVAHDPSARAALKLDHGSRVLVINTEGANDPESDHRLAPH